ncbi:sensor domain-containing diguanylate cyclase [Actinoplanes sp. KI2]|uniref:sensor domain-containing diguanylate cyclase n=1 Tax=Actinoplanes sp. KI2 TaxID=2983315 RepID=UPI0021D5E3E8|nr:sensor domain-containing diguanylate cyclase [Actinoplanes sp. KI2]MCU7725931.1 sensor domain-containing diguanylate cyclase [Actinoplanes sp. KI2]
MRLRNWIAVVVSVLLLAAAGTIGILVNRSALRTADAVHRADTQTLAVNNGSLIGKLQLMSAAELLDFTKSHVLQLSKNSAPDRLVLNTLVAKSTTFGYGALLTDLAGNVLTSSRSTGLPSSTDAGWAPMRAALKAKQAGFSGVMRVDGVDRSTGKRRDVFLQAVAVPVVVGGAPAGVLIGLDEVASTTLQKYLATLKDKTHTASVVDANGVIGAADDAKNVGRKIDPEIRADIAATSRTGNFVEYSNGSTQMIAVVVGQLPGGWAYVRAQSKSSFDGAVHSKSQTLNMTLLAIILIGITAISALGYRTALQRRRGDARFQALFQHAPDLVTVLDGRGKIAYSSPSSTSVLGFEAGRLTGTTVFDIVHPDDRPYMMHHFSALVTQRDAVVRLQCRVRPAHGEWRWFEFTASNQMHNPALNGVVINARDVSETRAFQERLAHEASHDALTGLPNRRRMQDALDASLREDAVAVLFVDLDGFKPVNDAHGHEAGDELLRQVAQRLSECVRENDVLARVGGDEFVVLMPGIHDPSDTDAMGDRIRAAVEAAFLIDGHEVTIGASVGVHLAPLSCDPDEALRAADHAMYSIKKGREPLALAGAPKPGRHRAEP